MNCKLHLNQSAVNTDVANTTDNGLKIVVVGANANAKLFYSLGVVSFWVLDWTTQRHTAWISVMHGFIW